AEPPPPTAPPPWRRCSPSGCGPSTAPTPRPDPAMRAVTIDDGRLVVAERPPPAPGRGGRCGGAAPAGISAPDLAQARGGYPPPPGIPADLPGLELAGEVAAVGPGGQRFNPGDRVMAVVGGAGQAELAVVHERTALPVPDGLSWPEAGGVPEAVPTAHDALFPPCRPAPCA